MNQPHFKRHHDSPSSYICAYLIKSVWERRHLYCVQRVQLEHLKWLTMSDCSRPLWPLALKVVRVFRQSCKVVSWVHLEHSSQSPLMAEFQSPPCKLSPRTYKLALFSGWVCKFASAQLPFAWLGGTPLVINRSINNIEVTLQPHFRLWNCTLFAGFFFF